MTTQSDSTIVPTRFLTEAPHGGQIAIQDVVSDSDDPYRRLALADDVRRYYQENGYVVVRNLISRRLTEAAREAFARQVRPYRGFIYRQTAANPEQHKLTEYGFILNPILNIQDLPSNHFADFKRAALAILTDSNLQSSIGSLLGESGTLVQSMYFDGNPASWAHQDTYYLDSSNVGAMTSAWIALEDIKPGAGRFFVYPGSHRIDMAKHGSTFDLAFNHERHKNLVLEVIRHNRLECRAPALRPSDVLFWAARTIHGSLSTSQPQFSRSSITAQFIPSSTQLLQFQSRLKPLRLRNIDGVQVHHPKDQDRAINRAILLIETSFPKAFQLAKKLAIKFITHSPAAR